jgi:hypothetical protein
LDQKSKSWRETDAQNSNRSVENEINDHLISRSTGMPTLPFLLKAASDRFVSGQPNPNSISLSDIEPSDIDSVTELISKKPTKGVLGSNGNFNHSFKINGSIQRNKANQSAQGHYMGSAISHQHQSYPNRGAYTHARIKYKKKPDLILLQNKSHKDSPALDNIKIDEQQKNRSEILNGYLNEIMSDLNPSNKKRLDASGKKKQPQEPYVQK